METTLKILTTMNTQTNASRKEAKITFLRDNEEVARKALSSVYSASCPNTIILIGDMRRAGIYGNLTPPQQIHANLVLIAQRDIGWNLSTGGVFNK